MTDQEIKQYLSDHNWSVDAEDCVMDMFNSSYQIIDKKYDGKTGLMTINTPDNEFTFEWNLHNYDERKDV